MSKKVFLLLIGIAFVLSSVSINAQTNAQKDKLGDSLKAAGYAIKTKQPVEALDWEKEQFDIESKYRFAVKSKKNFPGEPRTFYRFWVEIEVYRSEADAGKRLERLLEAPPGLDDKMHAEYVLRDGFQRANLIYIISTDAVMFSGEGLRDLKEKLEKAIE
ncbi:MAG: hypothetical protein R2747_01705 [Pyrinomonadaceae bacterium]